MIRHAVVLGVASLSFSWHGIGPGSSGCGGEDSSSGGVNAPCTRDYDCADGLTCEKGVCAGPADDGGGSDGGGGSDASGSDDAGGGAKDAAGGG